MAKRILNLHAWQSGNYADNQLQPSNMVLHLIVVPLFILAALLILDGVFSMSFSSLAIGVIGLIAALGIQRHAHSPAM
jgi:uncharacterized membrane protein YGL010W